MSGLSCYPDGMSNEDLEYFDSPTEEVSYCYYCDAPKICASFDEEYVCDECKIEFPKGEQ